MARAAKLDAYRGTSPIRKRPPPLDPPRNLGIGLRLGPKGWHFLMSEVPLYVSGGCVPAGEAVLKCTFLVVSKRLMTAGQANPADFLFSV